MVQLLTWMVTLHQLKLVTSDAEYDNVYLQGPLYIGTFVNASQAWDRAVAKGWITVGNNIHILGQV